MATNYTANYGLCQWEPEDNFLREEFNQDNAKIDAALAELESGKADSNSVNSSLEEVNSRFEGVDSDIAGLEAVDATKADSASVDSRFSTVNSRLTKLEGRVEVIIGSYTGDGAATRTISLGFTPKAVLVEDSSGTRESGGTRYDGFALQGAPCYGQGANVVEIVSGGFRVAESSYTKTNSSGASYRYLAFK